MKSARFLIFFIVIGLTAAAGAYFTPESGPGGFSIDWYTIDGGGGTSSGGGFELSGTIGQPDAGQMSGGGFTLTGGFWHAPPVACAADLNGDTVVNVLDLIALLGAWGPNPGNPADLNGDNTVNVLDLIQLLGAWGAC